MHGTVHLGDIALWQPHPGVVPKTIIPSIYAVADVPDAYVLCQNYPHQFNPSTTIFNLRYPSVVTIKIFNILCQEVATLLSGALLNEGKQGIQFNGSGYASGV